MGNNKVAARREWLRMAAAANDATPGITMDVSMCDENNDNKWESVTSRTAPLFRPDRATANQAPCYIVRAEDSNYRFQCGRAPPEGRHRLCYCSPAAPPPAPPPAPPTLPSGHRNCYLTVQVYDTDYDEADEYVVSTTANGVEIHGRCSPLDGANSVGPDDTWLESVIRVTAGEFSTEISWTVACEGMVDIFGGAPYNGTHVVPPDTSCTLTMTDQFGDGWNDARFEAPGWSILPIGMAAGEEKEVTFTPIAPTEDSRRPESGGRRPASGSRRPESGRRLRAGGFFECAQRVPLPPSPDATYTIVTTATPAVDENPYDGSFVYVDFVVGCCAKD